jgi:hypothetical protein
MSGPMGGWDQKSKHGGITARYNAEALGKKLRRLQELFAGRLSVKQADCIDWLQQVPEGAPLFLDPPYFVKGDILYPERMDASQHARLAEVLSKRSNWLLSYDICDEICSLYRGFAQLVKVPFRYCINGKKKTWKEKHEYLIASPDVDVSRLRALAGEPGGELLEGQSMGDRRKVMVTGCGMVPELVFTEREGGQPPSQVKQQTGEEKMERKQEVAPKGTAAGTGPTDPAHDTNGPQTHAGTAPVESGYESLDVNGTKKIYEELNGVLDKLASTLVQTVDQAVPELAKMQSLLSQRGADRKKVLRQAGLPGWTQWAKTYAAKLDRSFRTIQDRIKQYRGSHASGTAGPTRKTEGSRKSERLKLDYRQQAALVKAQLAASDLVAALKKGADWQTPLAEYEKVAIAPAKLNSFMNTISPEPDWKGLLTELVTTLERYGDRIPIAVINQVHHVEKVLNIQPGQLPPRKPMASGAKWYRVKSRTKPGFRTDYLVVCDGDKRPHGVYDTEDEANAVCESLNLSPVASAVPQHINPQPAAQSAA